MLLDMLGILIGFVAVILLLSILVTALIQTVSSFLRLRHRALKKGIDAAQLEALAGYVEDRLAAQLTGTRPRPLLDPNDRLGAGSTAGVAAERTGGTETTGAQEADALHSDPAQRVREDNPLPTTMTDTVIREIGEAMSREIREARSDVRVTWLNAKEMLKPMRAAGAHEFIIIRAEQRLAQALRIMEDKFLQWTRITTFVAALMIAALLQLSTPELLNRLQKDEEFRIRAEAAGEQLARETPAEFEAILLGPSLAARREFLKRHPQYTAQLGELTFEPRSVNDLVADFETVLDAEDNRNELAAEYRALIEKELADPDSQAMREAARQSTAGLAALGIQPVLDRSLFTRFANFEYAVGVLVTAVLLSFGAPFWYRILKELVGLKDALRKKEQAASAGSTEVKTDRSASA